MNVNKVIDLRSFRQRKSEEFPQVRSNVSNILNSIDDDICVVETAINGNTTYKIFPLSNHYSEIAIPQILKFLKKERPSFGFIESLNSDTKLCKAISTISKDGLTIIDPFVFCYHSLNIDLSKEEPLEGSDLKTRMSFEKKRETIQSDYLQLVNDLNWYFLQRQKDKYSGLGFVITGNEHKGIFYPNYKPKHNFTDDMISQIWEQYLESQSYNANKQILIQVMAQIMAKKDVRPQLKVL